MHKIKHSLILHNAKQLFATGSTPGISYGLPKIHKSDFSTKFQFRPLFAAYITPSFKLARSLTPILSPLATNDYTVDSTHSFVSSFENISNADKMLMAPFDIENLLTNMQVSETILICIIIDKLFIDDNLNVIELAKKSFKTLLDIAVSNSFLFLIPFV